MIPFLDLIILNILDIIQAQLSHNPQYSRHCSGSTFNGVPHFFTSFFSQNICTLSPLGLQSHRRLLCHCCPFQSLSLSLSLIALLSYRSLYLFIHESVSLFHLCLFLMLSLCCFRMVHAMAYSTMQRWEETVYVLCLLFFVSALKDDLSSHHYCFYFLRKNSLGSIFDVTVMT